MHAWIMLLIAGLFEVAWALSMAATRGWTRLWPSVLTLVLMGISFYLLSRAMRTIPVGTAYAVWTGIGAVGVASIAIWLGKEPATARRLICIGLIVAGIVGLKLANGADTTPRTPAVEEAS